MGANTFSNYIQCKTAEEGFDRLADAAREQSGNWGYSGTIAEKSAYTVIKIPTDFVVKPGETELDRTQAYANFLLDNQDPRVDDKWGPAGAIEVWSQGSWYFFGWASS